MDTKNKFIWFVLLSVIFSGIFILVLAMLFWQQLGPAERELIREILSATARWYARYEKENIFLFILRKEHKENLSIPCLPGMRDKWWAFS